MRQLPSLTCPSCGGPIVAIESVDNAPMATQFDDYLRRCEPCDLLGVGFGRCARLVCPILLRSRSDGVMRRSQAIYRVGKSSSAVIGGDEPVENIIVRCLRYSAWPPRELAALFAPGGIGPRAAGIMTVRRAITAIGFSTFTSSAGVAVVIRESDHRVATRPTRHLQIAYCDWGGLLSGSGERMGISQ